MPELAGARHGPGAGSVKCSLERVGADGVGDPFLDGGAVALADVEHGAVRAADDLAPWPTPGRDPFSHRVPPVDRRIETALTRDLVRDIERGRRRPS